MNYIRTSARCLNFSTHVTILFMMVLFMFTLIGCSNDGGSSNTAATVTTKIEGDNLTFYLDVARAASRTELGKDYASAILEVFPDFGEQADSLLNSMFLELQTQNTSYLFADLLLMAQEIIQNVPDEYVDEISGMQAIFNYDIDELGDGLLSQNELLVYQLSIDIFGPLYGSAAGVFGEGSTSGNTLVGLNIDLPESIKPKTRKMMSTTFIINGEQSIMNMGFTGLLAPGCVLGSNSIFACILSADIITSNSASRSSAMDLRYALETKTGLQEVANILSFNDYRFDHLVFLADKTQAAIVENDIDGQARTVRTSESNLSSGVTWNNANAIAVVNSFLLQGNETTYANTGNFARWDSLFRFFDVTSYSTSIDPHNIGYIQNYKGSDGSGTSSAGALFRSTEEFTTCQSVTLDLNAMDLKVNFIVDDSETDSLSAAQHFSGDIFTIPELPSESPEKWCKVCAKNTNLELDVDILCSLNNQVYQLKAGESTRWDIYEGDNSLGNSFSISQVHTSRGKIVTDLKVARINKGHGVHWYELTIGIFREWTFINEGSAFPMYGAIYRPMPWNGLNGDIPTNQSITVVADAVSLMPHGPYIIHDEYQQHDPAYQYRYNVTGDLENAKVRLSRTAKAREITDVDFELFGWFWGYLTYSIYDHQTGETSIWAVFGFSDHSRTLKMPLGYKGFDVKWYSWREEEWFDVSSITGSRENGYKVRAVVKKE